MKNTTENLIVIIPAYEPPKEFIAYAREVSALARALVVVDDGSGESYEPIFREIADLPNTKVISYPENHGKGYALKKAFAYCTDTFSPESILVTADCDGQHAVKDIVRVYAAAEEHPNALILGSRNFERKDVPQRSRLGNTWIRRLFHLLYGLNVYDTQTGLRGFSVKTAEKYTKVSGDRFEYEMNMLISSQKAGIPIAEVEIETIYIESGEQSVSHFRTFRDSVRVVGATLTNLNWYLLSSVLSAVVDVFIFFLISSVILPEVSAANTLIATVTARVLSSVINFAFNYKYVFEGKSRRALYRYYILWFCQLGASYGLVFLFGNLLGLQMTVMKAVGDLFLALISYQIQRLWVFKGQKQGQFYGPLAGVLRQLFIAFSKRYQSYVLPREEGVVYVARHLNMHGPIVTLKSLKFHIHPMIFSPFFEKETCYRQYADYTFTVRSGKKKKRFHLRAYIASRFVPSLMKSLGGIPVYRGAIDIAKTFHMAIECLKRGESVAFYPDIQYTAGQEDESEIYDGFLYLGQMYKKETGKSLKFVPLYINEEEATLREYPSVTVDFYRAERAEAAAYLKAAINGRADAR